MIGVILTAIVALALAPVAGGLIFGALGTIPPDGSTVELETEGLLINVTDIREHQVEPALVALASSGEHPAEAADAGSDIV